MRGIFYFHAMIKTAFFILLLLFTASCMSTKESTFILNQPTVIAVFADSVETEKFKQEVGEEDFYVIADDAMWYHSDLSMQLDTTDIDLITTDKIEFIVKTKGQKYTVQRDSSFGLYTYYFFDGTTLKQTDVFTLLGY